MNIGRPLAGLLLLGLAACGGAAPTASPSTAVPPGSAAASPPASSAAASAPAKPAASAPASVAPASGAAKPAASAAAPSGSVVQIKAGFTTISPTAGPLWVGKDRGVFARNGLDVNLTSTTANATLPAVMANELQFATTSPSEVANADMRGGNIIMIAEGTTYPIFSLYANKKYASVKDLTGQTIGVTAVGAASDTAAHLFLQKFEMEGKVQTTSAGGSSGTVLAAMQNGGLQAGIVQPPVTVQATDAGFVELVNGVKLGVPLSQGSVVITRDYLKANQDTVKRFLKAYVEGWQYCGNPANKADMIKLFAQYMKVDDRLAESAYQYMLPLWNGNKVPIVSADAIKNALSFQNDPKVKSADPAQFFDNSLIEAAAKEIG